MNWILIATIGYFFLALVNIFDKFLLSKYVTNSFVYTFFVGILSLAALVLIPFGFYIPSLWLLLISLIGGAFFILALVLFFHALKIGAASRVIPFTGGLIPLFIFALSYLFLGERLESMQMIAFFVLVAGSVMIATVPGKKRKLDAGEFVGMVFASLSFAVSFVLSKYIYDNLGFITGFIWLRIGSFLAALFILLSPGIRKDIKKIWKKIKARGKLMYVGNQALGGVGFAFTNYAISLTSVSLVNAMQGVQYTFVIIIAAIASIFAPKLIKEKVGLYIILQKVLAIILITIGIYLLYI